MRHAKRGGGRRPYGMTTGAIDGKRWDQVRRAALDSGTRFAKLVGDSGAGAFAMATKGWTVADSAAHVLSLASYYATLFEPGAPGLGVPGLKQLVDGTTVDTVRRTNAIILS